MNEATKNAMYFNKIQEIIKEFRTKYPKIKVEIIGTTSEKETNYTLKIAYSEDITMETHPDFFKSNGAGACWVVKTITIDIKKGNYEIGVSTDRTPMFKSHNWSDEDIEDFKNNS